MKYLLDTDTLIYVYKRSGNCLARLTLQPDDDIAVSSINLFELEFGIAKSLHRDLMERYLAEVSNRYTVLNFDPVAGRQAGAVRAQLQLQVQGKPISPYDVLVAGVALAHDLTIITRNVRELSRVPNLKVENWYD